MKLLVKFSLIIATIILLLLVQQYFFCPRINFEPSTAFQGRQWYNPYDSIQKEHWIKCNFHAHTNAWHSVTNGHGSAEDIRRVYTSLGYQVYCASEYQQVSDLLSGSANYIPAYEHGYNMSKTHQQVIGNEQVTWLDYIFPQTLSNKQHILDQLAQSGEGVVVLNHPEIRDGYRAEEMKYLQNFQCMEVLNPSAESFKEWDAVLSAGKPVFITANDDLHNIFDPYQSGKLCTWLQAPATNRAAVINALKTGRGYGMRIARIDGETLADRRQRIRTALPSLERCVLTGDSLQLSFDQEAAKICFIGDGGRLLKAVHHSNQAIYRLRSDDHYVRTAVYFQDGTEIYLNPVFRYATQPFETNGAHVIDELQSRLFFIMGLLILGLWSALLMRVFFPGKTVRFPFRVNRKPRKAFGNTSTTRPA